MSTDEEWEEAWDRLFTYMMSTIHEWLDDAGAPKTGVEVYGDKEYKVSYGVPKRIELLGEMAKKNEPM